MNNNKKIALYLRILLVTAVLLLTTLSTAAVKNEETINNLTVKYSFDIPLIKEVVVYGYNNDQVKVIMPGSISAGNLGEPDIPAHGLYLLLPQGTEIKDIEVVGGEKVYLGSGFNVETVKKPVKLSEANIISCTLKDESIYSSRKVFPKTSFSKIGTYGFRGYEVLVLLLYPIQYIPLSGELYYFKSMIVTVRTVENNQINPLFRHLEKDEIEAAKRVDNLAIIKTYIKETIRHVPEQYDFLILTTDEFEDSFEPLKNAHDEEGIKTKIKTLRDISLFPDSVTPEDIRDFIKDEYLNNGIEYVLIGGDYDIIPARDLYANSWSGGDTTFMPSDLYYACLDGTYNYDGDERWGEPTDGEDGSDVDLVAEVYVGRTCVGSNSEVDNFVNKTISHINCVRYSNDSNDKILMVGELLWSNPETWGGDCMDELINSSIENLYETIGIPQNQYIIDKLYERDWYDHYWSTSEIIHKLNDTVHIINHMGHSSHDYIMKMNKDQILSLTNARPFFEYSQGCKAGGFDKNDCVAEYLTVKTRSAAFAVIMNARDGWAAIGGTNGPSQRFQREFWDAVFGESIAEIGKANQDSKEDVLHLINSPCMRWCYYQLNLFGDPSLTFYNRENCPPIKPVKPSGVKIGKVDKEYNLKSTTVDDGNMIYYKWDFGDGTTSNWLGPYKSGEETYVTHSWSTRGIFKVKVRARDGNRAQSEWSDSSVVGIPIYNNIPILDSFFDFLQKNFPRIFSNH